MSLDRVNQGSSFAANECACAKTNFHIESMAETHCVRTEDASFSSLIDSYLKTLYCDGVLGSYVNVTLSCAYRITGYHHSFDNTMRIAFENGSVHECARIAFVGVTYDEFLIGFYNGSRQPLFTGGETCAAASSESAVGNDLYNLFGSVFFNTFFVCLVSVYSKVIVDIFGIDFAAVLQNYTILIFVEGSVVDRKNIAFAVSLVSEKPLYSNAANKMRSNYFFYVLSVNVLIECVVFAFIYGYDRSSCAKSETSGKNHSNLISDSFFGKNLFEFFLNKLAFAGGTTGTAANHNMYLFHYCLLLRCVMPQGC